MTTQAFLYVSTITYFDYIIKESILILFTSNPQCLPFHSIDTQMVVHLLFQTVTFP